MMRWLTLASISTPIQMDQRSQDENYLIAMIIMASIEMLIQTLHKLDTAATALDQAGYVMYDVKRVRPFITYNLDQSTFVSGRDVRSSVWQISSRLLTLGPPVVLAGPATIGVTRLHETGGVIEQQEGRSHRSLEQEARDVLGFT